MPRTADAGLEARVLDAAYQLWSRRGEKALTMRAVARTAGTTTPTLYQRFRDKKDILELLRKRAQEIMFSYMRRAHSCEEFCLRYFEFALKHSNEYELIHADWAVRLAKEEPRPSFDLLKKSLADRLGGSAGASTRDWRWRSRHCCMEPRHCCLPRECRRKSRASCGMLASRRLRYWWKMRRGDRFGRTIRTACGGRNCAIQITTDSWYSPKARRRASEISPTVA